MPTLEQRRRQTAADMGAARAATGEAERKAIGQAMIARRRGEQQVNDINAVVQPQRPRRKLSAVPPRGALAAQKGVGNYVPPRSAPGAGGVASPLTEPDYTAREYWPEQTLTSSDGLLSFRLKPIKKLVQADANSAEVVQQFAQPPVEAP